VVEDSSFGPPTTLRAKLGRMAQHIVPDLDQRAYFRARQADARNRMASGAYDAWMAQHPATTSTSLIPSHSETERPPHVVVLPDEGEDFPSWGPGHRNFYFEASQVRAETTGEASVSVFHVAPEQPFTRWHTQLIDYLNDVRATHVLTHIESDPGSRARTWTWDSLWPLMASRWSGVLMGVMFDSAYRHTLLRGRYLARVSPRFMLVDICMPMDGQLVRGRPEVGPLNLPMSDLSMALVDERLSQVQVEHDISFVGVLYPYRVTLIDQLRSEGLSVAVNPHRTDRAATRQETLVNQPGWLEYMAGLASSRATINFSESAARPVQQLKTRVIEAGLANTFLLTDDRDRTERFWVPGVEYGYFADSADLPRVAEAFLADPTRLAEGRAAFAAKARDLARWGFWSGVDRGLRTRGLPPVLANAPTFS
jgi:Glycosyl transferases group 1